jgi:hypothetical protein
MKPIKLVTYLIGSLCLGLISCNSDSETNHSPGTEPTVHIEIENLDGTFQRIERSKTIDIRSHLPITLPGSSHQDYRIEANSLCRGDHLNRAIHFESSWNGEHPIAVVNILSPNVFRPDPTQSARLICDISMNITANDQIKAQVELNDVEITHFREFSNKELPFIENGATKPLLLTELQQVTWNMGESLPQVLLQCLNGDYEVRDVNELKPFERVESRFLFVQEDVTQCLVTVQNRQSGQLQVSPVFYLQKERPQIEITASNNLITTEYLNLSNSPVVNMNIFNSSSVTAQIRIGRGRSRLEILPIYAHNHHMRSFLLSERLRVQGSWQISPTSQPFVTRQSSEFTYLTLPPQRGVDLSFFGTNDVICPIEPGPGPLRANSCAGRLRLAGLSYELRQLPQIEFNHYVGALAEQWQRLSIPLRQSSTQQPLFHYWSPFRNIDLECRPFQIQARVPSVNQIITQPGNGVPRCQVR